MLQHASSPEPDIVTTLRRCYVNYTGFLFSGEWSSNSHVWCARHCAVKCLSTWLMTSISSPKAIDDPFGLSLSDNMYAQQLWRQKLWRCRPVNLEQSATWPANSLRTLDICYKRFKTVLKTYMFPLGHGAL